VLVGVPVSSTKLAFAMLGDSAIAATAAEIDVIFSFMNAFPRALTAAS
jgi:hypothetical protein